jgi:hypothetical protein
MGDHHLPRNFTKDGVRIHSAPDLASSVNGLGYAAHGAELHGRTANDTGVYIYVTNTTTNVTGYVQDGLLDDHNNEQGPC